MNSINQLLAQFNVSSLDDNQIGHIMWVLNSPSYEDAFKPYLVNIRDNANRLMLDRTQARKEQYPDDYLAGQIHTVDGLLELFARIVSETDFERIRASQEPQTDEHEYARALAEGKIKPGGVNIDDYKPEEDF